MNILLIIIIAGLALLSLGLPDKIRDVGVNLSELVQQFPEQASNSTPEPLQQGLLDSPNFSNVGEQDDIPTEAVLGNHIITPDSELATALDTEVSPQQESFTHQDRHTLEDVLATNSDALAILERISRNYK